MIEFEAPDGKLEIAAKPDDRPRRPHPLHLHVRQWAVDQEHRWGAKQVPYEESIRVPIVISFPGQIPGGTVSGAIVSNLDIAPTIVDFAGASLPADGLSMRPLLTDVASSIRDAVVPEQLGVSPPTYCGV